jgi:PAS domain S-box-containing protein
MDTFAGDRAAPELGATPLGAGIEQVRDYAIFLVDRAGLASSWNEGVRSILGWERDDWIGQPVRTAFSQHDVGHGVPEAELRRARDSGRVEDERWMRRRNGEAFYALCTVTRLNDKHGKLLGYLKVLRDLTGPKRAQQRIEDELTTEQQCRALAEQAQAMFCTAIEASGDAICTQFVDGALRCNAAALTLLGAAGGHETDAGAANPLQRLRLRRERNGPALSWQEQPLSRALAGERSMADLWADKGGGGRPVLLRCLAAPVIVHQQVVGAVVVHIDLSHRLKLARTGRALDKAATELHERNAELHAVVSRVCDYAIFTVTPEGLISSWHEGARRMKGYVESEAVGMPFAQLFTQEDRLAGLPEKEMKVAARLGEYSGEGRRLRKDGTTFDAAVVLTALYGPGGELLGFLKLTQDISARKQLDREREQLLQQARAAHVETERTSRAKDEFLATLSHELRTPLSAILGWAQVLERATPDPAVVKQGLLAIARNARIQLRLIEDLLDMGLLEAGDLQLDLQRVDLGAVLSEAVESVLPSASAAGLAVHLSCAESGVVEADPIRLRQVVRGLLDNAIRFTPRGGSIDVTQTRAGDGLEISVSDTGQGIDPQFLPMLFERFQQQDATATRRHGGLGLGLALVHKLVQLHGGRVHAHSAGRGLGARFTVWLPAVVGPADQGRPDIGPEPGTNPRRLDGVRVLLVDDEADIRAVTKRVLNDAGAEVLVAASAKQALQVLRDSRDHLPWALLSDVGMPIVDGYDLLKQVRALPAAEGGQIPAAAISAYARPQDRARSAQAGYQLHLSKPVPADALLQAVADLVGRS